MDRTPLPPPRREPPPPPPTNIPLLLVTGFVCLFIGGAIGFAVGVKSTKGVQNLFESLGDEPPADRANPRPYEREGYSLQYPGNWSVDEEFDNPDVLLSIDSAGDSTVYLQFENGPADPTEKVREAQRDYVDNAVHGIEREPFDRWGDLTGVGSRFRGTSFGLKVEFRIFCHVTDTRTVTIVEHTWNEDLENVEPGFELIRETFRLK